MKNKVLSIFIAASMMLALVACCGFIMIRKND